MFRACLSLLLAASLPLVGCDSTPVGPREGLRAPSFAGVSPGGAAVGLEDAGERPAMVVFWASWCGPCREEAPQIAELVSAYGDRVAFFSINAGDDPTKARLTAEQWGMTWPVVLDPSGESRRAYALTALPLVLILDKKRIVRYRGHAIPADVHRILDGLR